MPYFIENRDAFEALMSRMHKEVSQTETNVSGELTFHGDYEFRLLISGVRGSDVTTIVDLDETAHVHFFHSDNTAHGVNDTLRRTRRLDYLIITFNGGSLSYDRRRSKVPIIKFRQSIRSAHSMTIPSIKPMR